VTKWLFLCGSESRTDMVSDHTV